MSEQETKALAACRNLVSRVAEVKRLTRVIGDSMQACPDSGRHLADAYYFDVDEEYGERLYLEPHDQEEILSECIACKTAHEAIQLRKVAKRNVASAKRAITRIGKSA
jgi:hypothetical protein